MSDIFGFHFSDFGKKGDNDGEGFSSYKSSQFQPPKHLKKWIIGILIAILAIAVVMTSYSFLMEYWQIKEIGPNFVSIFWTNLVAKALTQAIGFVILFVILLVNIFLLKRFAITKYFDFSFLRKKWPYVVLCLALALMASSVLGNDLYMKLLLAVNGGEFGVADPLFGQDIGYYIFSRPFLVNVISSLKSIVMMQIIIIGVAYFIIFFTHGCKTLKEIVTTQRSAFIHTVINVVAYFVLSILSYKFLAEGLMYSSFGRENDIFGAGYIEANIWMNYYKIAPFLIIAVILLVLVFLYRRKYIATIISIAVIPVAWIIVTVAAGITQSLVVSPNERNLQSKYIGYNMEATQQAYNLHAVEEKEFVINNNLSPQDIQTHHNQIENIRITDFKATQTAYNQLQYLRRYYRFNDVDIVPYKLNGRLSAVFVAPREMDKSNMEESAQSYANQVFRYTHGFGAVASPINRVTAEGQPEFYIKDIPPKSSEGMPEITQPRIYYGELTNDYVIVGPNNKELDYSEGVEDKEFSFDGNTGIQLNFIKKLMFSIYYGDYRMFFSGNIDSQSKILLNRNIQTRVNKVAPFFQYEQDPYMVIDDNGELKWVIDGYTTSGYYPYAQPYSGINYIRNSVKAIVDAYTGDIKFYVIDESDPIAAAYRKIYPQLFTDEPIDAALKDHIRVPEYLFKVQTQMYQRYHLSDPGQFYDKADVWRVATEKYENNEVAVEPYFNIMQVDKEDGEELVLVMPYVLGDKYNMVGMLMMRNCEDHYGELVLYRYPKSITVYGPMQIENKIDNDPEISREMTLWGQGGSTVIRGNLLVVPFKDALLYVEPVYITSKNNASLPEVKRIVVAYKDSIAMETTIDKALEKVLSEAAGTTAPQEGTQPAEPSGGSSGTAAVTPEELTDAKTAIQNVLDAYESFKSSSQNNDWKAMGESLDDLDKKMNELEKSK